MNSFDAGVEAVPLKRIGTCKLAVAGGLMSLLCPTGVGGLIGLVLGILGLGQIRASRGDLGGAAMAWLGIVLGFAQLVVVAAIFNTAKGYRDDAPRAIAGFMGGLGSGEKEQLEASMTTGLRPELDSKRGEAIRQQLAQSLGDFVSVGEANRLDVRWESDHFVVDADYDLVFAKGAPASARFTLVREYEALRVSAFELRSPVIPVVLGAKGKASQELGAFSGGKAAGGRKLKEFR